MKTTSLVLGCALFLIAIISHEATGRNAQEQDPESNTALGDSTTPHLNEQEGRASQLTHPKPFMPMKSAPTYHILDGYDHRWLEHVKEGIELSRAYWGSYGPTHVWILGYDKDDPPRENAKRAFLEEYCTWRTATSDRTMDECVPYAENKFLGVAARGESEAYLSDVRDTEPRMAELIFINIHKWHFEDAPIPESVLRGIHEYTHVAQQAFGATPTWMMEGGAVFSEAWLPSLDGRGEPEVLMERFMEHAQRIGNPDLSISDMEEIETAPPEIAKYHRELAYDSGAWAVAFMVYNSQTRSVATLRDVFYPNVTKVGWEQALCEYVGMPNKQAFYNAFEEFMARPRADQMRVYKALKP